MSPSCIPTPEASRPLALGELEAAASTTLAVFLPFNHAGVAGQKPVRPKGGIVGLINLAQGAGQTMAASTGLTVRSATRNLDKDIEFVFAGGNHKRLPYLHCVFTLYEILGKVFSINSHFSGTFAKKNASDGSLSSTGTNTKILDHLSTP
jgi:hypothetical protein